MIKVIRRELARNGRWEWRAEAAGGRVVRGRSRQPLLDACRVFKRMGVGPLEECGLFREGRSDWDLRTTVGFGAGLTVREDRGLSLERYREFSKEEVER